MPSEALSYSLELNGLALNNYEGLHYQLFIVGHVNYLFWFFDWSLL